MLGLCLICVVYNFVYCRDKEQSKQKKKEKVEKPAVVAVESGPKHFKVFYSSDATPELGLVVASITNSVPNVATNITKTGVSHVPYLVYDPNEDGVNNESVSGDNNIARFLLRLKPSDKIAYSNATPLVASQIDQWLDYATSITNGNVTTSRSERG